LLLATLLLSLKKIVVDVWRRGDPSQIGGKVRTKREREGLWNSRQTPFDIFDNGLKAVIIYY
jgi:hypothetical protein